MAVTDGGDYSALPPKGAYDPADAVSGLRNQEGPEISLYV